MIKEIEKDVKFLLMSYIIRERNTEQELQYIKASETILRSKDFFEVAKDHELISTIAVKLEKKTGIKLDDNWQAEVEETRRRLGFLFDKVERLGKDLAEHNIPLVLLKNGGIAIDIMDDLAECPMGDIDMMCSRSDFHAAHKIILQHGFDFKFRSQFEFEDLDIAFADGSTEYSIMDGDQQAWVELAWRPVAGRWIRRDKEPKAEDLINASHVAKKSCCRVLSNEDNLLQVSIHTAKHSYVRAPGYRLHLDVDRIVSNKDINWELFLRKVREAGVTVSVFFSLYLAKEILGTMIPDDVLKQIEPSPRRKKKILGMLEKAKIMHPHGRKFSKLEFLRFQTELYDKRSDAISVLFPPQSELKEKFKYNNSLFTPVYWFMYGLDLAGIRKSKKK